MMSNLEYYCFKEIPFSELLRIDFYTYFDYLYRLEAKSKHSF